MPTPLTRLPLVAAALLLLATLAACNGEETSTPTATPTSSPTATPTPTPTPTAPAVGTIVTFRVAGSEEYRVLLTDPEDIAIARKLLAGEEAPAIPNGRIVRGDPGVNTGYSWHIDPEDFEFADATIEVCDGLPSHVEDGTLTSDRFCPWSAVVVAVAE